MGKPLNTQATLLHGKVQLVELALRIAAGNGGVLNISHRVPFEDLARRVPGAILTFLPGAPQEQLQYQEYVKYFGSKARVGVVKLDDNDALYVVPPTPEATALLKTLEAAGAPPLPNGLLLGVVAPSPTPTGAVGTGNPAGTQVGKAPGAAATQPTEATAGTSKPDDKEADPANGEAVAAKKKDGDVAAEENREDGPEMSKEQLLDLFSNPELIQSLQDSAEGS
jgi:hypothetical protein